MSNELTVGLPFHCLVIKKKRMTLSFLNLLLSSEQSKRLAKVYKRYFLVVFGIAGYYFPYDADDATAEIFAKKIIPAVVKGHFHDEDKDDSRLVYTIANNHCRTIYQRKKRESNISSLSNFDDTISSTNQKDLARQDFAIDFKRSLFFLSETERQLIQMTMEGYSDKEITKKLGIAYPAVKRKRAKVKIAKFLEE